MNDVVFKPSPHKFSAIDFSQIKNEEYIPSAKKAVQMAQERIETIKKEETPNFKNTIEDLEKSTEELELVAGTFYNLLHCCGDESTQALATEMGLIMSHFYSRLYLDSDLFQKIKSVYNSQDNTNLNLEQKKLLKDTYKGFVRAGALLDKEKKDRLRDISAKLSELEPKFSENVLKATNSFELHIENKNQLKGLPDDILQTAKQTAEEANKCGWLFSLQEPSYTPFMMYCEDSLLRQEMYLAYKKRAVAGEFNNKENILNTISLRHENAQLLGFSTYADYVLEESMAQNKDTVYNFLNKLLVPSMSAAKKELTELQNFAVKNGGPKSLMPWDIAFYTRKLKEEQYKFSEDELRPYFSLENCIQGAFKVAEILYGLKFTHSNAYPKYHKDVEIYEVYDQENDFLGLLYADFFSRKTKSPGAWATQFKPQFNQKKQRPHVSIVCNFSKPTEQNPSLLMFYQLRTLFHEFGHALHSLLSQCQYKSLSGTRVYRDFVELPSQILENWTLEKESLDLFAIHYETKEKIPNELADKIKRSKQFMAGTYSLRQLSFAFLDMAWHTTCPSEIKDVEEFEVNAQKNSTLLPHIKGTNMSCSFGHIFSGGYAAGYYGYKWAEVLDADAFELFSETGIFNTETAQSFRKNILERGGSGHPMELYKKFRGREPSPNALLKREGLI